MMRYEFSYWNPKLISESNPNDKITEAIIHAESIVEAHDVFMKQCIDEFGVTPPVKEVSVREDTCYATPIFVSPSWKYKMINCLLECMMLCRDVSEEDFFKVLCIKQEYEKEMALNDECVMVLQKMIDKYMFKEGN